MGRVRARSGCPSGTAASGCGAWPSARTARWPPPRGTGRPACGTPAARRSQHRRPTARGFRDVTYSRDGKSLATALQDRIVRLWDAAAGKEDRTFPRARRRRSTASPSARTRRALARRADGVVKVWDLARDQESGDTEPPAPGSNAWRSLPAGGRLLTGRPGGVRLRRGTARVVRSFLPFSVATREVESCSHSKAPTASTRSPTQQFQRPAKCASGT